MNPRRRALMFRVMDGRPDVLPYLHFLDRFVRCDDILSWLIENRLTGKQFLSWSKELFGVSMLKMAAFVLSRLEKQTGKTKRPVIVGKDVLQ